MLPDFRSAFHQHCANTVESPFLHKSCAMSAHCDHLHSSTAKSVTSWYILCIFLTLWANRFTFDFGLFGGVQWLLLCTVICGLAVGQLWYCLFHCVYIYKSWMYIYISVWICLVLYCYLRLCFYWYILYSPTYFKTFDWEHL